MKKLLLSALSVLLVSCASAQVKTPFIAYTSDIVGDTITNTVTIQAWSQTNSITGVSTQLVASFLKYYYPTNPTGVITGYLAPGNYKLSISGVDRSITFGISATNTQMNLAQLAGVPVYAFQNFTLAQFSDVGTAAYSNAAAFLKHNQTNFPVSQITNAGTAAYSNSDAFLPHSLTNWFVAQITNAGTAAYSNSTAFLPHTRTNWAVADLTNSWVLVISNEAGAYHLGTLYATNINGVIGALSNGVLWSSKFHAPTLTNGINYSDAFSSPGTAIGSEQFGADAEATGVNSLAVGKLAAASGTAAVAVGDESGAVGEYSAAFGSGATAGDTNATALGVNASATHENATAVGYGATTTRANQTVLGSGTVSVDISGNLSVAGSQTNGIVYGTNSFSDLALRRYANTSLANGANAGVLVGTNSFIQVSGPSAAFTVAGLTGSPNRNGHVLFLLNKTGQDMTIANESGLEATAANRIITMTGADRTTTANGAAILIYSTSENRWQCISFDP